MYWETGLMVFEMGLGFAPCWVVVSFLVNGYWFISIFFIFFSPLWSVWNRFFSPSLSIDSACGFTPLKRANKNYKMVIIIIGKLWLDLGYCPVHGSLIDVLFERAGPFGKEHRCSFPVLFGPFQVVLFTKKYTNMTLHQICYSQSEVKSFNGLQVLRRQLCWSTLNHACINIYWQNPEFPVQFLFDFVTRRCQRYHELSDSYVWHWRNRANGWRWWNRAFSRLFITDKTGFCNTREETLSSVMGCRHSWHVVIYTLRWKNRIVLVPLVQGLGQTIDLVA